MDRSALLLSGSFGMGHDVMAEACEVSLGKRGWTSATMDSLKLMGNAASGIGERVPDRLVPRLCARSDGNRCSKIQLPARIAAVKIFD